MGILGLLKALEGVQRDCHVKELAGLKPCWNVYGFLSFSLLRCQVIPSVPTGIPSDAQGSYYSPFGILALFQVPELDS